MLADLQERLSREALSNLLCLSSKGPGLPYQRHSHQFGRDCGLEEKLEHGCSPAAVTGGSKPMISALGICGLSLEAANGVVLDLPAMSSMVASLSKKQWQGRASQQMPHVDCDG